MGEYMQISGHSIPFRVKRYKTSKHIRIFIELDGSVKVTAPSTVSDERIHAYLADNSEWIAEKVKEKQNEPQSLLARFTEEDYKKYRDTAVALITERVEHFAGMYGYDYNKITIRDQSTRWGSCSAKKNLSFNYKLLFLPPEQRDYVVVHEICHLKEMNHSQDFWNLVSQTIPDYKRVRKELKGRIS